MDASTKVVLVGGAPGSGKSTLALALANRLGFTSLSIDDLMIGAQAVTTAQTHPGLHVLKKLPYLEYFTNSSLDQLTSDATVQHEAVWPIVAEVIGKHVKHGPGIVIDGWHLRPERVAGLDPVAVKSCWLVIAPAALEQRERNNHGWLQGSADPELMLANFLARSLWYNDLTEQQAQHWNLPILRQDGTTTVDEHCEQALAMIAG